MKKAIRYIVLTIVLTTVIFAATGCLGTNASKKKTDLKQYMMLDYTDEDGNEIVASSEKGGQVAAVLMENEYIKQFAIVKYGEVFVDIQGIKSYVDDRFYWDSNENLVMFTNATKIYRTKVGESTIYSDKNEKTDYVISFVDGSKCFVNMKFIKHFIDLDYQLEDGEEPARLMVSYRNKEITTFQVKRNTQIRTGAADTADIVCDVDKKDTVTLIEKENEWDKVVTDDGYVGYILSKRIKEKSTEKVEYKNDDSTYTHNLMKQKVSMVWHQMTYVEGNKYLGEMTAKMKGVNVISPTWFSVNDAKGNIKSLASLEYVNNAHKKNLKVWALINDFSTDAKGNYYIKKVLTKTTTRQKLVDNIMKNVQTYKLDGINIDFEYINVQEGSSYLQFLRELSIRCRKAKVILTVDNYVPSAWTKFYDRKQQGKLADYIIVMNYDEHTAASDEAGSVSSMPYAKEGAKATVEAVGDSTRVINGMPFYTRIWCEAPESASDGKGKLIEDNVNGNYYLSSQAVSMSTAIENYKKAGVTPVWNEEAGQNYVYYEKNDKTYMIWMEDAKSVQERLKIIDEFNMGGAAYWKLGMETDDIWKIISNYFNK